MGESGKLPIIPRVPSGRHSPARLIGHDKGTNPWESSQSGENSFDSITRLLGERIELFLIRSTLFSLAKTHFLRLPTLHFQSIIRLDYLSMCHHWSTFLSHKCISDTASWAIILSHGLSYFLRERSWRWTRELASLWGREIRHRTPHSRVPPFFRYSHLTPSNHIA